MRVSSRLIRKAAEFMDFEAALDATSSELFELGDYCKLIDTYEKKRAELVAHVGEDNLGKLCSLARGELRKMRKEHAASAKRRNELVRMDAQLKREHMGFVI